MHLGSRWSIPEKTYDRPDSYREVNTHPGTCSRSLESGNSMGGIPISSASADTGDSHHIADHARRRGIVTPPP
jgi:hypothetical protein